VWNNYVDRAAQLGCSPDQLEDVMSTGLIVVIVIVAVLVVAAAVVVPGQMRSRRLRTRFGPEYDRVVENADDRKQAEQTLAERERRHSKYDLHDLPEAERAEYLGQWSAIQERFVDEPVAAVAAADRMVTEVMSRMGYPTNDFNQQAEDLSVEHGREVELYREAHGLAMRTEPAGEGTTDDLRNALLNYRELVKSLLGANTQTTETSKIDRTARA
jgi:hypothetical protein